MNKTIEFGEHNSLYKILYAYFVQNEIDLFGIKHDEISRNQIKKLISKTEVLVNSLAVASNTHKVLSDDRIQIPSMNIDFTCIERIELKEKGKSENKIVEEVITPQKKSIVIEKGPLTSNIDNVIIDYFKANLECNNIEALKLIDTKKSFCSVIDLIQEENFEKIRESKFSYELTGFIKEVLISSKLTKELKLTKSQFNFTGECVKAIINSKKEKESEFSAIIKELKSGLYDRNIYKFLQSYNKVSSTKSFQYLIAPKLEPKLSSKIAIENIIKPIRDVNNITENEAKYSFFESNKDIYLEYQSYIESCDNYNKRFFNTIVEYLYSLFKKACNATVIKLPILLAQSTSKKYNFSNTERPHQNIFLNITNSGEGLAKNVKIKSICNSFEFPVHNVGLLKAEELREVAIQAKINFCEDFGSKLEMSICWEEPSGKMKEKEFQVIFEVQDVEVPWDELSKQNPYSIQIIEERNKLYGRDEILEELQSNILSNNIESYKIWGQKRVGKSSIVKTLKSTFIDSNNILIVYRSILGLRNPDPIRTLNDLGESICSEILTEIENKIAIPTIRDLLKNTSIPTFNGSFYPLEKFISKLRSISSDLKFVFIIDEFDRINEEFFKASDLGEGFSGSIGKALNENKHIGFILVGSENMQLLDRQGMNYNSYLENEVDTFKKESQYSSFKNIVLGPVSPYIIFSEDSIERIFEVTNGNPYFTNLICKEAYRIAYKNKDSFIDIHLISRAIEIIVKSSQKSHFEHFWGDGLTEEGDVRKDRTTDIRRRVLVSFSICSSVDKNKYPTKLDILKKFKYPEEYVIEKYEVENTITEYFVRKIFTNSNNNVRIQPSLFESWLCGPGKTLMVEGVADLEALYREIELEKEFALKDEELSRLSETFEFQDEYNSTDTYREYFKQFGGSTEQRRVFKLIDSIYYISKDAISDFFRESQKLIFTKHEVELKSHIRKPFREGVELYNFDNTIKENKSICETFKVLSRIRTTKTIKNIKTERDAWKKNGSKELIIIEPVISETTKLISELLDFITEGIIQRKIPIRLITMLITTKAKTRLVKATSTLPNFKLIIYKEIEETKIKPFIQETELFENSDEANQAFAEVRKKFSMVSRESSLLVLFNSLCPSKSCPILWHQNSQFKPIFLNQFGIIEESKSNGNKEEVRRTKVYHANTELSQGMNQFIINHIKEKAKSQGKEDWFIVEYIPKSVMSSVSTKWINEGTKNPRESYFDFSDYKKVIEFHKELISIFKLPDDGLSWCDKLNVLRRDPAHPEKPAPTDEEVIYFEKIKDKILSQLILHA